MRAKAFDNVRGIFGDFGVSRKGKRRSNGSGLASYCCSWAPTSGLDFYSIAPRAPREELFRGGELRGNVPELLSFVLWLFSLAPRL
jgi:hypothetical protein